MQLPSIKAILPNKKPNRKGELPIMIRVTYNRKIYHKSTGISVKPEDFTAIKLISAPVSNAAYKNRIIKEKISSLELAFIKEIETNTLTNEKIKQIISGDKENSKDFENFVNKHIEVHRGRFSEGRINQLRSNLNIIKSFDDNISFSKINLSYLQSYEKWLRNGREDSTIVTKMKAILSFLNAAEKHGLVEKKSYSSYKIPCINRYDALL